MSQAGKLVVRIRLNDRKTSAVIWEAPKMKDSPPFLLWEKTASRVEGIIPGLGRPTHSSKLPMALLVCLYPMM